MSYYSSSSSSSSSSSGEYAQQQYGPHEYNVPIYYQPTSAREVYVKNGGTVWHTGRHSSVQHQPQAQPQTQTQAMCPAIPSTHNRSQLAIFNNQFMEPSTTLRTRYPPLPSYSPYENSLHSYGANSSLYAGLPFTSRQHGSGRSNCYSPTYSMGLSEVLASRAPGSSVLCLEPKRPVACRYICSLKMKQLIYIFLVLLALSTLGMVVFNNVMEHEVRAYEFVKNQFDAQTKRMMSQDAPETWPKSQTTNDEFKQAPTSAPDIKPRSSPATATEPKPKTGEKQFNVVYSFDDMNDDEAYIEDVIL